MHYDGGIMKMHYDGGIMKTLGFKCIRICITK